MRLVDGAQHLIGVVQLGMSSVGVQVIPTQMNQLLQFCRVTCMLQGRSIETITQVTSLGTRPSACEGLVPRLPSYMHACLHGPVAGRSPCRGYMHACMDQWQDEAQGLHACLHGPVAGRSPGVTCMLAWTSGRTKPMQGLHACLHGPVAG